MREEGTDAQARYELSIDIFISSQALLILNFLFILGTKTITVEEFLAIYSEIFKIPEKQFGTYEDFMEGLKLYDKESNGLCSLAELSQVLVAMGKCLDEFENITLLSKHHHHHIFHLFEREYFLKGILLGFFIQLRFFFFQSAIHYSIFIIKYRHIYEIHIFRNAYQTKT